MSALDEKTTTRKYSNLDPWIIWLLNTNVSHEQKVRMLGKRIIYYGHRVPIGLPSHAAELWVEYKTDTSGNENIPDIIMDILEDMPSDETILSMDEQFALAVSLEEDEDKLRVLPERAIEDEKESQRYRLGILNTQHNRQQEEQEDSVPKYKQYHSALGYTPEHWAEMMKKTEANRLEAEKAAAIEQAWRESLLSFGKEEDLLNTKAIKQ